MPEVTEPIAEVFSPRRAKGEIKLEFEEQDLKISHPEDADRLSAEYRTKIRAHYGKLKDQFPLLTCLDYESANFEQLKEGTF